MKNVSEYYDSMRREVEVRIRTLKEERERLLQANDRIAEINALLEVAEQDLAEYETPKKSGKAK